MMNYHFYDDSVIDISQSSWIQRGNGRRGESEEMRREVRERERK